MLVGFGIGLADVPTAVAVSPKRERYQRVKGSLTLTSVNALVDGFATGKGYSVPFQASLGLFEPCISFSNCAFIMTVPPQAWLSDR